MTTKDDGGPAFPQNDLSSYGMGPAETGNGGMTLRDWFAGQAMQAVITGRWAHDTAGIPSEAEIAADAYLQADAMIAARNGGAS